MNVCGEKRGGLGYCRGQDRALLPAGLVKKNGVIYPSLALAAMEQSDRSRFVLLHAGEGGERGRWNASSVRIAWKEVSVCWATGSGAIRSSIAWPISFLYPRSFGKCGRGHLSFGP
jgi:hypothetical protein